MSARKHDKPKVAQQEFLEFLHGLTLKTLRVKRLKVDAERDFAHKDMQNVEHTEKYGFEMDENGHLMVEASYIARIVGKRKKKLGSIEVTFGWYYTSEAQITEEIFEIFAPMIRFQTWPHLREIIQSVAARANWPRLTLPLLIAQEPPEE